MACGQCNIAMRFSYFWCSSFHGKHKLTQMDHFVRRYKQYSDRQKNTGENERKLYVSSGEETKPTTACKLAIPMLFPLLPPLSRLATSMRLIRAGLGWKGWSSCLLVEWLPYPRESVERFGAGFNQEQSFQIPYQRASICTGDFLSARLPVAVVDGLLTNPPSTPRRSGLLPHFFSPHVGYMIHALNAMVPWWLKVTSYTERNHVPERLMDGTYVEGLCAYQARIETTSNL